jgi:hypothetical protein
VDVSALSPDEQKEHTDSLTRNGRLVQAVSLARHQPTLTTTKVDLPRRFLPSSVK